MSEKPSSSSSPDSPEDKGGAIDPDEATTPDSEVPTLPDVSGPGVSEGPAICPSCGSEIPPEAPRGLCPKCALAGAAIPTDVDSIGGRSRSGPRFQPPEIETIAAAFPQLEIVELIGCGGMGAVYKARQPHLDRFVALKILPPSLAETPSFTERFTREGRLLARLSHPAIVGVHDFGQAGGFFFLLMEYVDGVNLRQAMRAGRFTPEQALDIVPKVCEALQFAHDEGVLHRDIKPENILLDSRGAVKIADFGIAKLLDEAAEIDPALTGSMAPGTPHYMAPEQIEHPGAVDHRADIYSLGVVFYEMLTGELPIGRFAAPSEKSAVDSQVDEIVFRSLEKERDRRQQSAGEVKTEIEGIPVAAIAAERHPGYAIPAGAKPVTRSSGGSKAALIVLAGFLLPLILNLVFLLVLVTRHEAEQKEIARSERARAEASMQVQRTQAEADLLADELSGVTDPSRRDELGRQLEEKRKRIEKYRSNVEGSRKVYPANVTVSRSWFWAPMGSFLLLALLILGFAIPGTVMGWRSLRRIRALELPEGRIAPMFAALLFPLLLLGGLVFALIALPLNHGPRWIGAMGISISVIVALALGFWIVRAVWRWLNSAPAVTERHSILEDFEKPRNPWPARLIWLGVILLGFPFPLIGLYLFAARGGVGGVFPGFLELVIVAAVVGILVLLIRFLTRGSRSGPPVEARTDQAVNPWPRRVFWLLILVFVVPVFLIVVALIVPWLAYEKRPARSHAVWILEKVENEHSVSVRLDTRRFTDQNVNVAVSFEGPEIPGNSSNDHELIYPGQGQEWNLFGDTRQRSDTITFALPDRETAALVSREISRVAGSRQAHREKHYDERRIELFNVMAGQSGAWRAWIEMRSGTVAKADSPPVEELLAGDWIMEAGTQEEIVLTFDSERRWSSRARELPSPATASGIWKFRGGGRLELEIFESSTDSKVGESEHLTIESIDESVLVIRGWARDDPDRLTTFRRIELPLEADSPGNR